MTDLFLSVLFHVKHLSSTWPPYSICDTWLEQCVTSDMYHVQWASLFSEAVINDNELTTISLHLSLVRNVTKKSETNKGHLIRLSKWKRNKHELPRMIKRLINLWSHSGDFAELIECELFWDRERIWNVNYPGFCSTVSVIQPNLQWYKKRMLLVLFKVRGTLIKLGIHFKGKLIINGLSWKMFLKNRCLLQYLSDLRSPR